MGGEPGEPSILPAPPCCLQAFLLYRGILWVKIGPASLRAGSKRFLKSGLLAGQNPANGSGRRFSGSRKSNRVGSDRVGSGQEVFEISWEGPDGFWLVTRRVGSGHPDHARPAKSDLTRQNVFFFVSK